MLVILGCASVCKVSRLLAVDASLGLLAFSPVVALCTTVLSFLLPCFGWPSGPIGSSGHRSYWPTRAEFLLCIHSRGCSAPILRVFEREGYTQVL